LDNFFFEGGELFESDIKNEAAACNITRYRHRMAQLIGYIWSKDAAVGVCVSALD